MDLSLLSFLRVELRLDDETMGEITRRGGARRSQLIGESGMEIVDRTASLNIASGCLSIEVQERV